MIHTVKLINKHFLTAIYLAFLFLYSAYKCVFDSISDVVYFLRRGEFVSFFFFFQLLKTTNVYAKYLIPIYLFIKLSIYSYLNLAHFKCLCVSNKY